MEKSCNYSWIFQQVSWWNSSRSLLFFFLFSVYNVFLERNQKLLMLWIWYHRKGRKIVGVLFRVFFSLSCRTWWNVMSNSPKNKTKGLKDKNQLLLNSLILFDESIDSVRLNHQWLHWFRHCVFYFSHRSTNDKHSNESYSFSWMSIPTLDSVVTMESI